MNKKEKQKDIEFFMQEAINLAKESMETGKGGPFGAVVVKDGKIIGKGSNNVTQNNDPTAHAEITAIRNACKNLDSFQLDGCEIYTSCEPCPMCLGAIYWSRPAAVYYAATKDDAAEAGFDDEFIYEEIAKPLDKRNIPMKQIYRAKAREIFVNWIKKEDKIKY